MVSAASVGLESCTFHCRAGGPPGCFVRLRAGGDRAGYGVQVRLLRGELRLNGAVPLGLLEAEGQTVSGALSRTHGAAERVQRAIEQH